MTKRAFLYFRNKKHMTFLYKLCAIVDDYQLARLKRQDLLSQKLLQEIETKITKPQ